MASLCKLSQFPGYERKPSQGTAIRGGVWWGGEITSSGGRDTLSLGSECAKPGAQSVPHRKSTGSGRGNVGLAMASTLDWLHNLSPSI